MIIRLLQNYNNFYSTHLMWNSMSRYNWQFTRSKLKLHKARRFCSPFNGIMIYSSSDRVANFQTLTRVSNNFARTQILRISISRAQWLYKAGRNKRNNRFLEASGPPARPLDFITNQEISATADRIFSMEIPRLFTIFLVFRTAGRVFLSQLCATIFQSIRWNITWKI